MKKLSFFLFLLLTLGAAAQESDRFTLHFHFNRSVVRPEDSLRLQAFLNAKLQGRTLDSISLYGHCDGIGSHRYNDSLSLARVSSTQRALMAMVPGPIVFSRLEGKGEREPAGSNADESGRSANRRVIVELHTTPLMDTAINTIPVPPADTPSKTPDIIQSLKDTSLTVGQSLTVYGLQFFGGRHLPLPGGHAILDQIADVLQSRPTLKIEIRGFVCCTSEDSDGYDLDTRRSDLSVQRARYAFDYLTGKGISEKRMRYKGYGGSRKVYPEELTEAQRSANRRIEIIVTEK